MAKYFDKFPLVNYNGVPAKNILAKTDFTDRAKRDIYSNFDYVLPGDGLRVDQLSEATYNTPYYDWMIYISNGVVDPYYGVHLSATDFDSYILDKYGSIDNAKNTVLFYRNNWYADDLPLRPTDYDQLSSSVKNYYSPMINNVNQVVSYKRKQEDWIRSTNKIQELTMETVDGFEVGFRISQDDLYGGAYGFISAVDIGKKIVTVQHVEGTFTLNPIYASYISNIVTVAQVIPDEETRFWSAVDAYEDESEKNELKRYINLIKNSYVSDVEKLFMEQIRKQ